MEQQPESLYEQIGEDGMTALIAAFYRRVKTDDILSPMYPKDDWDGAEQRLRDFLVYRFGGPDRYIQERGHPRLGMRHQPFPIDEAARDRWIDLMRQALVEVQFPEDLQRTCLGFFVQVAAFLQNRTSS